MGLCECCIVVTKSLNFFLVTIVSIIRDTPVRRREMLVMANKFGDNLKKIRVEKNVSQQELADLMSTHSKHLSRYECNLAAPSIDLVKKIAEALEVALIL